MGRIVYPNPHRVERLPDCCPECLRDLTRTLIVWWTRSTFRQRRYTFVHGHDHPLEPSWSAAYLSIRDRHCSHDGQHTFQAGWLYKICREWYKLVLDTQWATMVGVLCNSLVNGTDLLSFAAIVNSGNLEPDGRITSIR
jgi:hypothetical protein